MTNNVHPLIMCLVIMCLVIMLIIIQMKIAKLGFAIIMLTLAIYYFKIEIKNAQQSTLFKLTCSTCSSVCVTLIVLSSYYYLGRL